MKKNAASLLVNKIKLELTRELNAYNYKSSEKIADIENKIKQQKILEQNRQKIMELLFDVITFSDETIAILEKEQIKNKNLIDDIKEQKRTALLELNKTTKQFV